MVSVHLYNEHAGGKYKIAAATLWAWAGGLAAAWLLAFGYFAKRVAVPKFRHTLWSKVTGRQVVQEYFTKGESDETKIIIFGTQRLKWEGDIGREVKQWTFENWEAWERDKPAWFTPRVVASVPDEYIPKARLEALGSNRQRRGSAAGSVRESQRICSREEEGGEVEGLVGTSFK